METRACAQPACRPCRQPLLLSCAAAEASDVCHRPGDVTNWERAMRVPGLRACPGCSGCRSAAWGAPASALAFQLAHHLRAWPAVIPTAVSVCFQGHDCGQSIRRRSCTTHSPAAAVWRRFCSASPRRHAALQHSMEQSADSQKLAMNTSEFHAAACASAIPQVPHVLCKGGIWMHLSVYMLYV